MSMIVFAVRTDTQIFLQKSNQGVSFFRKPKSINSQERPENCSFSFSYSKVSV